MTAMFDFVQPLSLYIPHTDVSRGTAFRSQEIFSYYTQPPYSPYRASQPWQVNFTAKMSDASGSRRKDIIIIHINLPGSVLTLEEDHIALQQM